MFHVSFTALQSTIILQSSFGKQSFETDNLNSNFTVFLELGQVSSSKP